MTLQEPPPLRARRLRRAAVAAIVLAAFAGLAAGTSVLLLRDASAPAPLGDGPPDRPPGLGDLWSGRASLVLDKKWRSPDFGFPDGGIYGGAHVEIVDGTWYLFNRRTRAEPCEGHGPQMRQMETEVRASTDGGATWGKPVTIVAPTPGTPWACAATDGDAVYDEATRTWRYLFQCQGATPGWHGCLVERRQESPLGMFKAPGPNVNPVIAPGMLWSRICDDPGDECARAVGQNPIADEGTFSIVGDGGDGWWVGFHGTDGARAYRGIARTTTFRRDDWQVDGAGGTPADAALDTGDAAGWRESWAPSGPVGAGAASMLEDDGAYYQLAEVPDVSLACTPGQNWNLGLYRASAPASTKWEQYPLGNPIVYSSRAPDSSGTPIMCNVEYPGLFEDPDTGTTYLMHGRLSEDRVNDGIYVYRVEWDRNLLDNGGFWRADADGWEPRAGAPAQISVERRPDSSPDGTPYLSLNCGAPTCDTGPSVYQDVPVPREPTGGRFAFGGTFRSEEGEGRLEAAVLQLDEAGAVVESTVLDVRATTSYARARGELQLDPRARRLRFELYPRTPGSLRADNLYLIPQDGCQGPRYPAC